MLVLVAVLFVAAACTPALAPRCGRFYFPVLAAVLGGGFAAVVAQTSTALSGHGYDERTRWAGTLGLDLDFRMGALQWVMALVVTGIGALVLLYCTWYFHDDDDNRGSFGAIFLAFAGAMLGLVLADNLLLVYVFWELTTIFSYLMIGTDAWKRSARLAALQALLVTTFGGLAMLIGLLVLGQQADTYRISEILAHPPSGGTSLAVAIVLILVGAMTKSALVPFHFWLPGAMSAPTPVSAYLHAASMVKAGVYLVALLAPAFAGTGPWRPVLLTFGVLTMLVGGWRALRQHDIKLVLAYGTVSQLGFLLVVSGVGTRAAAVAAVALLVAHALFKSCLFLVVGIIDHNAGTRDLRELSGVGAQTKVLLAVAVLSAASMAGMPPVFGFIAKESVLAAFVDVARTGDGTGVPTALGWALLVGLVLGSVLTVAYTLRFLWGAFATKPGVIRTPFVRVGGGFAAAPVLLGAGSVVMVFLAGSLTSGARGYTDQFPAGAHKAELALWHGFGLPLAISLVALVAGALLFRGREPFETLQRRLNIRVSAQRVYEGLIRGVDRTAVEVTGLTQQGSVSAYLTITLLVVVSLPGAAMLTGLPSHWRTHLWDTPSQAIVAVVIISAAVCTARSRRRLPAVALLGVTGYGCAVLFALHGAPDLALTQVLVETMSLVVFVLVLRRLPERFRTRRVTARPALRAMLGLAVSLVVAGFMLVTTNVRTDQPVSTGFPREAVEFGGGHNIVSVTLVDIRAWDTMGEISVLVAAATGVASLIFIDSRRTSIRRVSEVGPQRQAPSSHQVWLDGGRTMDPEGRSIIFEVVTRLTFHALVMFGLYLLFAGHNFTGGGFAAGIVTGLALVVRYLAGGRYELNEAAPVDAGTLMGVGLATAATAGLAPLLAGGAILQSYQVDLHLPVLGDHHIVTSLFFDIGVYCIVIALILDLLRTFGARIDRQILQEREESS